MFVIIKRPFDYVFLIFYVCIIISAIDLNRGENVAMHYNAKQLQIINVAERLFARKGFTGTSVRDIAQEANVNVSMISYYFGSKEKLIEALFELRANESRLRIENVLLLEGLTPIQKVYIMIDGVIDRIWENECFHTIIMRQQLSGERTTYISDHIMALKVSNGELMLRLVTEGQEAGVFRKNIDLSLLTTTLFGTINQAIATQDFYRKINHLEHLADQEFRNLLKRRLSLHLKNLFKLTVSNEQNNEQ